MTQQDNRHAVRGPFRPDEVLELMPGNGANKVYRMRSWCNTCAQSWEWFWHMNRRRPQARYNRCSGCAQEAWTREQALLDRA